ncbi:MAG TPA: Mth938-like domain-containing protein [Xanthobacteraceae bacterium]
MDRASPHLPRPAQIEAYGKGGFSFAGMSHRGSLLCRPDGIWASPVRTPHDITDETLALVFAEGAAIDHFLIGTGRDFWPLPPELAARLNEQGITAETMTTGSAVMTYNILLDERRRVGALLIAVD